jgi:PAS domain S-box-containing protein
MFNTAAETMFGWTRDEAIGAPLASFLPERYRADHDMHVRRFGETGVTSRRMGATRVVMGLRRDGHEFPIDAAISQIREGGTTLYTVILRDVSERVASEAALRRSRAELQELASLSHQTREQEQRRIARELHDELGQALTALKMMTIATGDAARAEPGTIPAQLERMQAVIDETLASTRRIASELRPLVLDDLGLGPAIEWLVDNLRERTPLVCDVEIDSAIDELDDVRRTALFRIVQESFTNIARHANATSVKLSLRRIAGEVILTVDDDGAGFEPAKIAGGSRGLLGIRERVYLLGGQMEIASSLGGGTSIEVRIPLQSVGPSWP